MSISISYEELIEKYPQYKEHLDFCRKIGRPNVKFVLSTNGKIRYKPRRMMLYLANHIDLQELRMDCQLGVISKEELIFFHQDIGSSLNSFKKEWQDYMNEILGK